MGTAKGRTIRLADWPKAIIGVVAVASLAFHGIRASAQESVDPLSGQLVSNVTDLSFTVGAITLQLTRSLVPRQNPPEMAGARWRFNWDSRLVSRRTLLLLEDSTGTLPFVRDANKPEFKSAPGDRIAVQRDGSAVRTRPDGSTEIFDKAGRLVGRDFRNGNVVQLQYGTDGQLSRVVGPKNSFLQFTTDGAAHVLRVDASTGSSVRYAYANGLLTEVQVNGAAAQRYSYDARGALTRIEDPRTGTVDIAYDPRGRVLSRRWADGALERFEYDDALKRQRRTDPTGAVTITQLAPGGRRVEDIDALGAKTVVTFDPAGRLESVTGPTGDWTRIAYDPLGRPTVHRNSQGRETRFDYVDSTSRVKAIARPDGTREMRTYDAQKNVTGIKLGAQTLATLSYHPDGTLRSTSALGVPQQGFTYDGQGRLQGLANALGDRLELTYDARGNPVRAVNPLGGVTVWQWDAQDRLVSETDPVGGTTRYEYDAGGRVVRVSDSAGAERRFEYNARGRMVAGTESAGSRTRYEYDLAGRITRRTDPDGSQSFAYDGRGDLIRWNDSLGPDVQFERDLLGRVIRQRTSAGLQMQYRYDALGRVVAIEDSGGGKREWQRDARGRVTAARDATGASTRFEYDALDNLTSRRDPRGQVKEFGYGADGLLARVREASGDTAEYRYDAAGRLTGVVRPSGGTSSFMYDALGNMVREVDPLGNERRKTYDVAGRLVSSSDAAGRSTKYGYDAGGRLTEKRLPNDQRVRYRYDVSGRLLELDDGRLAVRYQYDAAGRRVRIEYPAIKKAVAHEYDADGLQVKLIDADGRGTRYEYNAQKLLATLIPPDGKAIAFGYDAQQRLQSIKYPNGLTGQREYDSRGRITRLAYVDASGQPVAAWTYRYDPDGNLVEQKDAQGQSTAFNYDPAGQLTEVTGPSGSERYGYGKGGNRVASETRAAVQYRHDAADRLIEAGPDKLSYDANGNLAGRAGPGGTTRFEHDFEDRLVKVSMPDGKATTFGYAPTGQRAWKRDADGLTNYVYDGLDLIQELDDKGSTRAAYTYGPGIDQPLVLQRGGQTYYYHADRLGSIRLLSDSKGKVVATYDYEAFGKPTVSGAAISNPFTFTGREWDGGIGLYYFRARYYDPVLGRFLSADALPGTLDAALERNPYLYTANSPTRYVDPLGLAREPTAVELFDAFQKKRSELVTAVANLPQRADPSTATMVPQAIKKLDAEMRSLEAQILARENYTLVSTSPGAYSLVNTKHNWTVSKFEAGTLLQHEARVASAQINPYSAESDIITARIRIRPPSGKTLVLLVGPALLFAGAAAAQAEPGHRAEAATDSLKQSGSDAVETAKFTGECAAVGAAIGFCAPVPGGTLVGARIGASVPLAIDLAKLPAGWILDAARYAEALPRLFPMPLPPGSVPPTDPSLPGSVTGGLPGAPPPGAGYDPRNDPALRGALPANTAKAGQAGAGFEGGAPAAGGPGGGRPGLGGMPVMPQPPLVAAPPASGTSGPPQQSVDPINIFRSGPGSVASQAVWCWSDQAQSYYQTPTYPCPPTRTTPTGPPPSAGAPGQPASGPGAPPLGSRPQLPQPGATAPAVAAGGVITVPQAPPLGGTGGGGTTPAKPPPAVAQAPAAPTTPSTPSKPATPPTPAPAGGQCTQPICSRGGQTDCLPVPAGESFESACYRNMLARCNQGMAGRTGGWCVHKGADPSCEVRAKRVCSGG